MSADRSVALFGATGLVGGECLRLLLREPGISRVVAVTRRPLALNAHDVGARHRLETAVFDFTQLERYASTLAVDQIFCALGTTIKKAGSQPAFRKVDFDYPLAIARNALAQGARHFLLVSALGANAASRVFYSRVKGELEDAVLALPFRSHTVVRPSLLLGDRNEFRLGERIAARIGFLVPAKYKPVSAAAVARVLVAAARDDLPGKRIIESAEIRAIAREHID